MPVASTVVHRTFRDSQVTTSRQVHKDASGEASVGWSWRRFYGDMVLLGNFTKSAAVIHLAHPDLGSVTIGPFPYKAHQNFPLRDVFRNRRYDTRTPSKAAVQAATRQVTAVFTALLNAAPELDQPTFSNLVLAAENQVDPALLAAFPEQYLSRRSPGSPVPVKRIQIAVLRARWSASDFGASVEAGYFSPSTVNSNLGEDGKQLAEVILAYKGARLTLAEVVRFYGAAAARYSGSPTALRPFVRGASGWNYNNVCEFLARVDDAEWNKFLGINRVSPGLATFRRIGSRALTTQGWHNVGPGEAEAAFDAGLTGWEAAKLIASGDFTVEGARTLAALGM